MSYYSETLPEYFHYFSSGTIITILLAMFTVIFGSIIGSVVAMMRLSDNIIISSFAKTYISIIRGTPLIVQLYIGFFQLGKLISFPNATIAGLDIQRFLPCIIVLAINSGAYVAELIRAGIQAVDRGQLEAARSIGMTKSLAMIKIILPQAIKNILPAIGSEFVTVIKETAVIQYLGVSDIMFNTGTVISNTYVVLPNYYVAAAIYFILTFSASSLVNRLEKNMNKETKTKSMSMLFYKRPNFS